MPIQLTISGDHATDIIAELQILTQALNGSNAFTQSDDLDENEGSAGDREIPKKLRGPQHQFEADKMIKAGKRDFDIYQLLSWKQKQRVDDALKELENQKEIEHQQESVDAPKDEPKPIIKEVVTPEVIDLVALRALLTVKVKDENGLDIPEKLKQATDLLIKYVPEGMKASTSNIPEDMLPAAYKEIEAM